MTRYLGLDVHAQSSTLAVVGPSGRRISTEIIETSAAALIARIDRVARPRHLCMEEGSQSAWLYEALRPHVDDLVVVGPRQSKAQKSDSQDALELADMLRRGTVDVRVFKAPTRFTRLRELVRLHRMLTQDVVRTKNRLRAIFRSRGVEAGRLPYAPTGRERLAAQLPASHGLLVDVLGQELDTISSLRTNAEEQLIEEAGKHPIVGRLATAPGIGTIRAAQIVATVVVPERFRTKRQFWSYCGLAVVTHSSSDWVRDGKRWVRRDVPQTRGLTRKRNPLLKVVFKSAALNAAHHMRGHPLFRAYATMLENGTKPNLALVTIARRIAGAVLAMWKNQEDYDPQKHELLTG